jgi:hypothetical protein
VGTDRYQIIQQYLYLPVLTAIFCYCSYNWAVQINIGVFLCISPLSLSLGGRGSNILSYYSDVEGSGDFIAEEADGVGDKGTGISTSVDLQTHLVAFLEDFHTWEYSSAAEV